MPFRPAAPTLPDAAILVRCSAVPVSFLHDCKPVLASRDDRRGPRRRRHAHPAAHVARNYEPDRDHCGGQSSRRRGRRRERLQRNSLRRIDRRRQSLHAAEAAAAVGGRARCVRLRSEHAAERSQREASAFGHRAAHRRAERPARERGLPGAQRLDARPAGQRQASGHVLDSRRRLSSRARVRRPATTAPISAAAATSSS